MEWTQWTRMMAYTANDANATDAERLTALTKANALMKAHGETWALIGDRCRQATGPQADDHTPRPAQRGPRRDPFTVNPDEIFGADGVIDRVLRLFEQQPRVRRRTRR